MNDRMDLEKELVELKEVLRNSVAEVNYLKHRVKVLEDEIVTLKRCDLDADELLKLDGKLRDLVSGGQRMEAVQLYRCATGKRSLRGAIDYIKNL